MMYTETKTYLTTPAIAGKGRVKDCWWARVYLVCMRNLHAPVTSLFPVSLTSVACTRLHYISEQWNMRFSYMAIYNFSLTIVVSQSICSTNQMRRIVEDL